MTNVHWHKMQRKKKWSNVSLNEATSRFFMREQPTGIQWVLKKKPKSETKRILKGLMCRKTKVSREKGETNLKIFNLLMAKHYQQTFWTLFKTKQNSKFLNWKEAIGKWEESKINLSSKLQFYICNCF